MRSIAFTNPRLTIGLGATVVLDTVAQLVWKAAALRLPVLADADVLVHAVMHEPLFIALSLLFLLQLWVWLKVLEHADLSFAQPITALSYVTVGGLATLWFAETMTVRQLAGIALVLLGVWFVSRGPARNDPRADTPA